MLYLHAGTVKTGTTYIQKISFDNRALLMRHGIKYMPVDLSDLELPRFANAKFLYESSLIEGARAEILNAKISDVLISEEGLWGYANHLLNPIFAEVPKKIILYIRPTSEVLCAWAAEHCQPYNVFSLPDNHGFHSANCEIRSIDDILEIVAREYAVAMGRIIDVIDVLGPENFIVRPYEKASLLNNSLLSDFFAVLGLNEKAIRADPDFKDSQQVNPTSNRKYCDISRIVWNKLGRPNVLDVYNYHLVQEITQKCKSGDSRPVVETLSDEQISWFTDRFEWVERYLSRNLLKGRPMFLSRYPRCFGNERDAYAPVNVREVELLLELYLIQKYP